MKTLYSLLFLLLSSLSLTAQKKDPPRYIWELGMGLVGPSIEGDFTDTGFALGLNFDASLQIGIPIGKRVQLSSGLGLGLLNLSQQSTVDQERCDAGGVPCNRTLPAVTASYISLYLNLPVDLKVFVGPDQVGPYVKVRSQFAFLLSDRVSAEVINPLDIDNPFIVPAGETDGRDVVHWLSAGIGYRLDRNLHGYYMEIAYSYTTNSVVDYAGPFNRSGRTNYLRTSGARSLSLVVGYEF